MYFSFDISFVHHVHMNNVKEITFSLYINSFLASFLKRFSQVRQTRYGEGVSVWEVTPGHPGPHPPSGSPLTLVAETSALKLGRLFLNKAHPGATLQGNNDRWSHLSGRIRSGQEGILCQSHSMPISSSRVVKLNHYEQERCNLFWWVWWGFGKLRESLCVQRI